MTDPTHENTKDRLRATLRAAAPGDTGVEDFIGNLRDRIDGTETGGTVHRLDRATPGGASKRHWVLAAAAVVAAVAIGTAVLATRDESPSLVTVGGPGKTTSVAPVPANASGWYVPEGLPDGWSVKAITTEFMDADVVACPCPSTTWLSPDGTEAIVVNSWVPTTPLDSQVFEGRSNPINLGGVPGWVGSMGTTMSRTIIFDTGGRRWAVTATDDDGNREGAESDTIRAAVRVLADPEAAPLDGFEKYESYTRPGGVKSFRSVSVELRTPAGHRLVYSLYPSGFTDNLAHYLVPSQYRAEGQVESASQFDWPAIDATPSYTQMVGRWLGADVIVNDGSPAGNAADGKATRDEIIEVLSRLRPVSSDAWNEFARTSGNLDSAAIGVARVNDLLVSSGSEGGTTVEGYGTKFQVKVDGENVTIGRWQPAENQFVWGVETRSSVISVFSLSDPAVGLVTVPPSFDVSLPPGSTIEMSTPVDCGGMTCAVIRFTSKQPEEANLKVTSSDSAVTVNVPIPKTDTGLFTQST
ncbi:MAG: hypothetical protein ABIP03_11145 [Aquihabitans sp.]